MDFWCRATLDAAGVIMCEDHKAGRISLVYAPRDAVKGLLDAWDTEGVYILLARNGDRFYARPGKGKVADRFRQEHLKKPDLRWWTHAALVRRRGDDTYETGDVSYLEGLLHEACDQAPLAIRLGGKSTDHTKGSIRAHGSWPPF